MEDHNLQKNNNSYNNKIDDDDDEIQKLKLKMGCSINY